VTDLSTLELTVGVTHPRHPKCKGEGYTDHDGNTEYDCGYNTTIECDECKYCLHDDGRPVGRKDPAAKCNQMK
jgi:hypothetical protein